MSKLRISGTDATYGHDDITAATSDNNLGSEFEWDHFMDGEVDMLGREDDEDDESRDVVYPLPSFRPSHREEAQAQADWGLDNLPALPESIGSSSSRGSFKRKERGDDDDEDVHSVRSSISNKKPREVRMTDPEEYTL